MTPNQFHAKRTANGIPALPLDSNALVAIDAICAVSGVNFGSVAKVFAALELVAAELNCSADDLVKFEHMPLQPCQWDGTTNQREHAVRMLVHQILTSQQYAPLQTFLRTRHRLTERFAGDQVAQE